MKREVFRFLKDEEVTRDDFVAIESAIRERTEARDDDGLPIKESELDDIDMQYAKGNFEVIIKTWIPSRIAEVTLYKKKRR